MSRGRLVLVYGTRPESIKIGPVAAELKRLGAPLTICCTGQHTTLLDGMPSEQDLAGAASLNLPSNGKWEEWVPAACRALKDFYESQRPISAVIVQGDTMSAFAAAMQAHHMGIPVAHVEAGLRSHDRENPFPEEMFRTQITQFASWYYAPTKTSVKNLLAEGVSERHILRTGNTVVSALARYSTDGLLHITTPKPHILVTLHRREWLADPDNARHTVAALFEAATHHPELQFRWPVHPTVHRTLDLSRIAGPPTMVCGDPLPYQSTIHTLRHATGLITDSGGLQEEAATLGIPTAVLRTVSDRPESITAGMARLFPPTPDGITRAFHELATGTIPRLPSNCYGDENIRNGMGPARIIATHLSSLT